MIVRPQTPEEFADTLVEKVIAPMVVTPETARLKITTHPPDVRVEPATPDTERAGPPSDR